MQQRFCFALELSSKWNGTKICRFKRCYQSYLTPPISSLILLWLCYRKITSLFSIRQQHCMITHSLHIHFTEAQRSSTKRYGDHPENVLNPVHLWLQGSAIWQHNHRIYLWWRVHIPGKIFYDMNTMFDMNSECFDYQSLSDCFVFQAKNSNNCRLQLLRFKDLLLSKWIVFGFWTVLDETCDEHFSWFVTKLPQWQVASHHHCDRGVWGLQPEEHPAMSIITYQNCLKHDKITGGRSSTSSSSLCVHFVKVHANFFAFGSYSEDFIWQKVLFK